MVAKYRAEVLVCTIEREDEAYIANGDFTFQEKDVVSIIATPKNAHEFFTSIKRKGHSIKNAMVVGGGIVTHYLCDILERSSIGLKIIEKDLKTCEELSARWEKTTVIHGDASDKELLKERSLQKAVSGIKKKYGKNSMLKGMNLEEGATAKERNGQIGGHKA